jgi:hypothetical protein
MEVGAHRAWRLAYAKSNDVAQQARLLFIKVATGDAPRLLHARPHDPA